MYLLFALLLAQPESIRVELKGAEHVDVEVRLLQGAMTRRVVSVPKGTLPCSFGCVVRSGLTGFQVSPRSTDLKMRLAP